MILNQSSIDIDCHKMKNSKQRATSQRKVIHLLQVATVAESDKFHVRSRNLVSWHLRNGGYMLISHKSIEINFTRTKTETMFTFSFNQKLLRIGCDSFCSGFW